jgi:hypothetical protein
MSESTAIQDRRIWRPRLIAPVLAGLAILVTVIVVVTDDNGKSGGAERYENAVLSSHPLAFWRLGESTGNSANDEAGEANGVYRNGVALGVQGAIAGSSNTGAAFDGINDSLVLRDSFSFPGRSPFTLEAWVKPAGGNSAFARIFSKEVENDGGRFGYTVWLDPSVGLGLERLSGQRSEAVSFKPGIPDLKYTYIVATFAADRLRLYENGRAVATTTDVDPLRIPPTRVPLTIGSTAGSGSSYFEGAIDEVAVYDRALSAIEVEDHFAAAR